MTYEFTFRCADGIESVVFKTRATTDEGVARACGKAVEKMMRTWGWTWAEAIALEEVR